MSIICLSAVETRGLPWRGAVMSGGRRFLKQKPDPAIAFTPDLLQAMRETSLPVVLLAGSPDNTGFQQMVLDLQAAAEAYPQQVAVFYLNSDDQDVLGLRHVPSLRFYPATPRGALASPAEEMIGVRGADSIAAFLKRWVKA